MEEKTKNKNKTNKSKVVNKDKKVVETKVVKEAKTKKVESKLNNKENNKSRKTSVSRSEVANLIKIVLVVTAIFVVFYGITTIVTNNEKEQEIDSEEIIIQYDEILLGTLFSQAESEYYVLVTKEDDNYKSVYSTYLSTYETQENAIRVYTSNLDNGFNMFYKDEHSNTDVSDVKDLKLKDSTLLKIKDKKVVVAYEGYNKIIEHLKSLIK